MKSLLVDAIREAAVNDADQSAEESGVFDAAGVELGTNANDEQGSPDGEFELMASTRSLVVAESHAYEAENESGFDEPYTEQDANKLPPPARPHAIRQLARFSPLLCLIASAMAAGGWISYQHVAAANNSTHLGAVVSQSRMAAGAADMDAVNRTEATRFPFLIDGQLDDSEGILP